MPARFFSSSTGITVILPIALPFLYVITFNVVASLGTVIVSVNFG